MKPALIDYKQADVIRRQNQKGKRERRLRLIQRDQYQCWYCGERVNLDHSDKRRLATIDHLIPITKAGTENDENLVTACHSCNCQKAGKTLEEYRYYCQYIDNPATKAIAFLESALSTYSTPFDSSIRSAIGWLQQQYPPYLFHGERSKKNRD